MKSYFLHGKRRALKTFRRFSRKLKSLNSKVFILEIIQNILKRLIDGKDGPFQLSAEAQAGKDKQNKIERIFNNEPKGIKMTDREKLMKIEEALHKMRDNYRAIKANKSGAIQMYTNKDLGDLVCKDLDKLFSYMETLESQ